jgi:ribonuclease Z
MEVTILGSGSGGAFQGRNYTSHLLYVEHVPYLIDCGEGTQHQLYRIRARYDGLQQIFITHLHGDHVFGLPGLLTSFCLKQRTQPLEVFGPEGIREMLTTITRLAGVRFTYDLIIHEVDATVHAKVFENELVEVFTIPLEHRTLCTGWLFKGKIKLPNMRVDKIEEFQIPSSQIPAIKEGGNWTTPDGKVIPHAELTSPPKTPPSYAFCSDTAPSEQVAEWVKGVSTLYHEATFTDEHIPEARLSMHSTAREAARIAQMAGAGKLLMGHFSSRYKDTARHMLEAREEFPESYVVVEGERYKV